MRPSQHRMGRGCSRAGCRRLATMTMTYIYADSTAVLGPLATFAEPHAYDLCQEHSSRMSVPQGWVVIKQEVSSDISGPSDDDLMAIANAVREVGARTLESDVVAEIALPVGQEIGRRGHLRAIPN